MYTFRKLNGSTNTLRAILFDHRKVNGSSEHRVKYGSDNSFES